MAQITVKQLEALRAIDNGKRLPDGDSLFGIARITSDAKSPISVDFQWRYKINGKRREIRIGTWPKFGLKEIRDKRDQLRAEVASGHDPIDRKTAEKLARQADQQEAIERQKLRLEEIAVSRARQTVRGLFVSADAKLTS
jgi:hypothetical protein